MKPPEVKDQLPVVPSQADTEIKGLSDINESHQLLTQ